MTASLWRRLVDLPPHYVLSLVTAFGRHCVPENAATTEEIGATPTDLAQALAAIAAARNDRVYVAILSEGQALAVQRGGQPGERIMRVIQQAARTTPLHQRVTDYGDRPALLRGAEGPPAAVVVLWRGSVLADVSARKRSRTSLRLTLNDEAIAWVRATSERDGASLSDVVNDLILARAAQTPRSAEPSPGASD